MTYDASYLLPLRRERHQEDPELAAYLLQLSRELEVVVVDGSPPNVFADHHRQWGEHVVHVPVVSRCLNGKVAGIIDGVQVATGELVVIADDDVRYDDSVLRRVLELGASADLVRPQNYFDPLPWHARWDTARTLLNRAAGADYPGTLVMRRAAFLKSNGYCGAVLFENLELIRTLKAHGAREVVASDVYVRRLPPPAGHFRRQRVRQAYDSLAQPGRLAVELSLLPTLAMALAGRSGRSVVVVIAVASVVLAEVGRRRHRGSAVFSADAALWAPLWVVERAVCIWLALAWRACGGVPYAGRRLRCAAHPTRRLSGSGCPEECCSCEVAVRWASVVGMTS